MPMSMLTGHLQEETELSLMHMSMLTEDVVPSGSQRQLSCAPGATHDCQIAHHAKQIKVYAGNARNAKARLICTK